MGTVASDRRSGPRALFALMAGQHGVASTVQARRVGVSRAVEERLVAEGALGRLAPGVLTAGGVPLTFSAQAMAAALRPGVIALSHGAAARLHRLAGFEHHATLDVIGARGTHLRVEPPMRARYSRRRIADDVVAIGAIPVTSVPLTLTLIAHELPQERLVAAVASAVRHGGSIDEIRTVAEEWRGNGRPGPVQLIDVLDAMDAVDAIGEPAGIRWISVAR